MRHTIQKGFTLVEMIVVLGIFAIITSVVVFNYGKFRSDTILTNMAYEVALSIREAQIYGVSARNAGGSSPDFSKAYGIFIPTGDSGQYFLFADTDESGYFTGSSCSDLSEDTCLTPYTMQRNVKISDISYSTDGTTCPSGESKASILFKRPNPEPVIAIGNNTRTDISFIQIAITAPEAEEAKRYIVVYNNGQIAVVNSPTCE